MKDVVVLLLLLSVHTSQVCSQSYVADSNGNCFNPETHFKLEEANLCCSKCEPGHRLKRECTINSDTLCELCPSDQYLERRNYSPNCIACISCKPEKGLIHLQNCSRTTNSRCGCQPGMYCIRGFNNPYCSYCTRYKACKAGFGVALPGTADRDVKCQPCPNGTFSNTVSHTDRCQPHTNCEGRAVTRQGNSMVDTVCEPANVVSGNTPQTTTGESRHEIRSTTSGPTMMVEEFLPKSTTNISSSVTVPPRQTRSNSEEVFPSVLAAVGVGVGALIFVTATALLIWWKTACGKGAAEKIDANGNCHAGDKMGDDYFKETQLISYTQEQECLLKEAEACSSQSQSSNSTDLLTRSDDCSSFESIGPSQSTAALHGPHSTALSEPRPLRSHRESIPSQTSVLTQPPSQPTSPHVISPITTSPHVNVNITFNIGNGSEKTHCVTPTSLVQSDCHLQFGEEEEAFSIPQQEAGKEAVVTVQESTVCCT